MEGHHDAGARGEAAQHRHDLAAEAVDPVQVDDLGTHLGEDGGERVDPAGAVEPAHHEAVVGPGAEDEIVALGTEGSRFGLRPLQGRRRDEEARRHPGARREGAGEVAGDDLGTAGGPVGVVVGDLENPEALMAFLHVRQV